MKRARKTYGACLNTFHNIKNLTRKSQDDRENLVLNSGGFEENKDITIPWKAISLAVFLCIGGVAQLIGGAFIYSGHIGQEYEDRFYPFMILGIIMFLPGAYHLFIALQAYRKVPGYSFSDIPDFD